jgi:hypothetical protein
VTLSVTFLTAWDAKAMQTEAFVPRGAHAALLTYEADPWPDEGGLPPALAAALAAGLCACGELVGRWFDNVPPPAPMRFLPAPRQNPLQHLRNALPFLEKTCPASLAVTRDPLCAEAFFDTGWTMQYQTLLVIPEGAQVPAGTALPALQTARDWRDFTALETIIALCAPAVDGDAALLACATAAVRSQDLPSKP